MIPNSFGRDEVIDGKVIRAAKAQGGSVREKKSGEGIRTILCAFEGEGSAVKAEERIGQVLQEEGLTPTREYHTKLRER